MLRDIGISAGLVLVLGLPLLICRSNYRQFEGRCRTFCDTTRHLHGFSQVLVKRLAEPTTHGMLPPISWEITLRGPIQNLVASKAYAKGFADNVAPFSEGLLDSVIIVYEPVGGTTYSDRFANTELYE